MTLLDVGWVAKAHGLRGDVIVHLTTDRTEERTAPGAVFVSDKGDLVVESAQPYQKNWLVTFRGINSREAAEGLRGTSLQAEELDDEDLVFAHQLIGKIVIDQHGTEHGPVLSLIDNPASDLLELSEQRLIPMAFYRSHDGTHVVVEVPLGLLDDGAVQAGAPE